MAMAAARWIKRQRNSSSRYGSYVEELAGKTILLHSEQGLGDTLQFVRYAALVAARGARVLLDVQPPLRPLLAGMENVSLAAGEPLPPFDLHCPLMSLPLAFGTEPDSIPASLPYLRPSDERLAGWQHRLGEGASPRVGIVWAGSRVHKNNRNRSIPLDRFAGLLSVPGIEFVSLQKDTSAADAAALAAHPNVTAVGGELADFADTAAVIAQLDLVVSVDTWWCISPARSASRSGSCSRSRPICRSRHLSVSVKANCRAAERDADQRSATGGIPGIRIVTG